MMTSNFEYYDKYFPLQSYELSI